MSHVGESDVPTYPARRRWTRDEFERAAELGLFGPEERLELIGGEVLEKMTPQSSPHAAAIRLVRAQLQHAFPRHLVDEQLPLALGDESEPEPDVAVVEGSARDYITTHPRTALLVVEVAESSLRFDRGEKASLYAQAGIPEYWIVNLADRVLEVHREPAPMAEQPFGHHYRSLSRHLEAEDIAPLGAPTVTIRVADLLP